MFEPASDYRGRIRRVRTLRELARIALNRHAEQALGSDDRT